VGLATLLGVMAVLFGPLRPELYTLIALVLFAIAAFATSFFIRLRVLFIALGIGAGAAFVTLLVSLDQLAQRWSPADQGQRVIAEVQIDSLVRRTHTGIEFDAELVIEAPVSLQRTLRARVSWNEPLAPLPRAAERWRLLLQLSVPRANTNPGGFDEQREFFRDRVHARAVVLPFAGNRQIAAQRAGLLALREQIVRRIRDVVVDRDAAALFAGLAVGATGEVTREQWRVFSDTGTTHLVAISGMHVTLFCWVVAALARSFWARTPNLAMRIDRETFAAMLGVPAAAAYAALAGFGIPAQRTVVMLAVWWILRLSGRVHSGFDVLGFAAVAVLAIDPFAPLSSGFWLSFVAMATLIAAGDSQGTGLRAWFIDTLRTQWRVSLALLPITILWFSSFSVAGLLVNFAAIPVFSLILVPIALLGSLLGSLAAPLAKPLWWIGERAHEWLWPLLVAVAAHPYAAIQVSPAAWVPMLGFERPAEGEVMLTLLDAGEGTSLIVRTRQHALVYDTGESYASEGRSAERLVVPALRSFGVSKVDRLVLSGSHAQRAAGAARLLASLPVDRVIGGGEWPGAHRRVEECSRGERWDWEGVEFESFGLPGGSCALRVDFGGDPSFLIADRLDAAESAELAAQAEAAERRLRSTVIVTPRRGSVAAVSSGFVEAVDAQWVMVPGGKSDPERFARLARHWRVDPFRVVSTAAQGAVTLHLRRGLPPRWLPHVLLQGDPLWRYHPRPVTSGISDAMQDMPSP
jgi:competence protein ComEC